MFGTTRNRKNNQNVPKAQNLRDVYYLLVELFILFLGSPAFFAQYSSKQPVGIFYYFALTLLVIGIPNIKSKGGFQYLTTPINYVWNYTK